MTRGRPFTEESEPVGSDRLTLIEGPSFLICDPAGDIVEGGVDGLFVADTRICSRLTLTLDDEPLEPLTAAVRSPFAASIVARSLDRSVLVFRDLWLGRGMRVDIRLRNLTRETKPIVVKVSLAADLAHPFAVKEGRAASDATQVAGEIADGVLRFVGADRRRGMVARADGAVAEDGSFRWRVDLEPGRDWSACLEVGATRDGEEIAPRFLCSQPTESSIPSVRHSLWLSDLPTLETDVPGLEPAFRRAAEDLGGLRMFEPDRPDEPVLAAGAPWYMTLFGRDSILASWMAMPLDPTLGLATVRTLARLQGKRHVPETDEQPGRILHEVRLSASPSMSLRDGDVYYGSIDATPLFVMLVHELWRWGVPLADLDSVLPAVEAALDWLAGPGDPGGDGYVEYAPAAGARLQNQGWKDSLDAVSFADGRAPEPPIALAEVQAYAYAAWRAGAALAEATGREDASTERLHRAGRLRRRFERDFWLEDRGAFALALDRGKRPVDAIASNMGHCLWAGIVHDRRKAEGVARWLTSPELFTGWGVRTLATSMARYNPLTYHNGSVWPHDTAICAAGLRRSGFVEESVHIASGLLGASRALGDRLPELFGGLTPEESPVPVPYPAACSPEAWASAAPLMLIRSLLGLEPDIPGGRLHLDPALPAGSKRLRLEGLPLAGTRISIDVDGDGVRVRGLPRGVAVGLPER